MFEVVHYSEVKVIWWELTSWELISWELISWEVDLVGVDLVGVDFVGVDLVGMNPVLLFSVFFENRLKNAYYVPACPRKNHMIISKIGRGRCKSHER